MKKIIKLLALTMIFAQVIVAKPTRAVSTAQFTTEILLSIGAADQMAGTAYLDDAILPSLKAEYEKVPVLSPKSPTKEKFYSVDPDFLTGWKSILNPKALGPVSELEANGVQIYIPKSLNSSDFNDVFADILKYGEIFELQDNANKVVDNMKKDLATITKKLPKEKVKVFAYDSGTKAPFVVAGGGIGNTIINYAGGENIFADVPKNFATANWEKVLLDNPDVIIIVNYGDTSADAKIKFLKEESPIKDLKAVKENKFVVIGLSYMSVGVRNVEAIKILAKAFHNVEI